MALDKLQKLKCTARLLIITPLDSTNFLLLSKSSLPLIRLISNLLETKLKMQMLSLNKSIDNAFLVNAKLAKVIKAIRLEKNVVIASFV